MKSSSCWPRTQKQPQSSTWNWRYPAEWVDSKPPTPSLFHLGRQLPPHTPEQEHPNTNTKEFLHTLPRCLFYHNQDNTFAHLFNLHRISNTTDVRHQNTSCAQRWGTESQEHTLHALSPFAVSQPTEVIILKILAWESWHGQRKPELYKQNNSS